MKANLSSHASYSNSKAFWVINKSSVEFSLCGKPQIPAEKQGQTDQQPVMRNQKNISSGGEASAFIFWPSVPTSTHSFGRILDPFIDLIQWKHPFTSAWVLRPTVFLL